MTGVQTCALPIYSMNNMQNQQRKRLNPPLGTAKNRNKNNQKIIINNKDVQKLTPAQQSEVARMLNSALRRNIETKVTYVTSPGFGVSLTSTIVSATTNMSRADQGVDGFTGNIIHPTAFRIRGSISTDQTFSTVRVLSFQFADASTPTMSTVLSQATDVRALHSPILWSNIHKIRVLYDETFALKPGTSGAYDNLIFDSGYIGGLRDIEFASASTSVQMNGIFTLFVSDDSVVSYPQCVYVTELLYTDA